MTLKLVQRKTVETVSTTARMVPEKSDLEEKSELEDPSQLTQSYYNKNTAVLDKR